jgi:ankyrin repeat protein
MRELLDGGADIEAPASAEDTPLHVACRAGAVEAATLLLDKDAPVDTRNADRETPLVVAGASFAIVQLLLDRGANVSAADFDGISALHTVAGDSFDVAPHEAVAVAVATLLLKRGADIDARDDDGRTPLLRAVDRPWASLASFLVGLLTDFSVADKEGRMPLHVDPINSEPQAPSH